MEAFLQRQIADARIVDEYHRDARSAVQFLGASEFRRCYSFGFVRNPWDRMVSWFHWSIQNECRHWTRMGLVGAKTFPEFLANEHPALWSPQVDFYRDLRGNMLVEDIFCFEDFNAAVQRICLQFSLPESQFPHENKSRHAHYTTYYTPELRKRVEVQCARDIQAFEYTFGE